MSEDDRLEIARVIAGKIEQLRLRHDRDERSGVFVFSPERFVYWAMKGEDLPRKER